MSKGIFVIAVLILCFGIVECGCSERKPMAESKLESPLLKQTNADTVSRMAIDTFYREGRFYADEDKAFHFAFGKEKGAQAIKDFGGSPSQKTAYDHTQQ